MKNRQINLGRAVAGRELRLDPEGLAAGWLRRDPDTNEMMGLAMAISLCLHVIFMGTAGLRLPKLNAPELSPEPYVEVVWPGNSPPEPPEPPKPFTAQTEAAQPADPQVISPRPFQALAEPVAEIPPLPDLKPFVAPAPWEGPPLPGQGSDESGPSPQPGPAAGGEGNVAGGSQSAPNEFGTGPGKETGSFPQPNYPAAAQRARETGVVRLNWRVTAEGQVTDATVVVSSGHSRLDQATLEAVRRVWRFEPGRPRWFTCQFVFDLKRLP